MGNEIRGRTDGEPGNPLAIASTGQATAQKTMQHFPPLPQTRKTGENTPKGQKKGDRTNADRLENYSSFTAIRRRRPPLGEGA